MPRHPGFRSTRPRRAAGPGGRAGARPATPFRRPQQPKRGVECARPQARFGGGERSVGAPRRIAGQRDRTLQERGRGRETAPGVRSAGRTLQLHRNVLIGAGGRGGQMPRTAIRIDGSVRFLPQSQMHSSALRRAGGPVRRRAHQRMAEGDTLALVEQPIRRVDGGNLDPETLGRVLQEQGIADRLRGCDQQQKPRVFG